MGWQVCEDFNYKQTLSEMEKADSIVAAKALFTFVAIIGD